MSDSHPVSNSKVCALPWVQLSSNPLGQFNYCCEAWFAYNPKDETKRLSAKEYWNSDYLTKVRKALIAGDLETYCRNCKIKEEQGLASLRQSSKDLIEETKLQKMIEYSRQHNGETNISPTQLDIRFSPKCNMRCRMCTPFNSSEISSEYKKNREAYDKTILNDDWKYAIEIQDRGSPQWNIPELIEMCPDLDTIVISGGEPLLQKEFYELLDELRRQRKASQIRLQITTNGSVFPKDFAVKLLGFKKVDLLISVDGMGPTYDYIRFPYKWDQIAKQILKFNLLRKHNLTVRLSPTLQALNLLTLPDLIRWCEENRVDFELYTSLVDPAQLSIDILPPEVLPKVQQELKALLPLKNDDATGAVRRLIESLSQRPTLPREKRKHLQEAFLKQMALQDRLRKQSLEEALPELNSLLRPPFFPMHQIRRLFSSGRI